MQVLQGWGEPVHIHVIGKGGDAKYMWNGEEFVFCEQNGIKANDLKRIKEMIDDKKDVIIQQWEQYFKI